MLCPKCQKPIPEGVAACPACRDDNPTVAIDLNQKIPAAVHRSSGASPAPVPTAALSPGTVLVDRFEIVQLLGEGGMGSVYKAIDREFDRPVALKTIRSDLVSNPNILNRFKQELLLARQVSHKNIVRLYDIFAAEGVKFITMEFVEGEDLKTILKRGKPPVRESVSILLQVCQGLEAAHAEHVVHRDLKPPNIMVDANGRVAVMDFGLAHSTEEAGMTKTGILVGTPDYMSPEQALGRRVDHRSDIFSLGLILYELLTGELPFRSESMIGTLVARTRDRARRASELCPELDEGLDAILNRCLEPDPNARYQSVTDLAADMRAWLQGHPMPSMVGGLAPVESSMPFAAPTTSIALSQASLPATAPAAVSIPAGTPVPAPVPAPRPAAPRWAVLALLVVAAVGGWFVLQRRAVPPRPTGKPVKVLVADFANNTGDPLFDRTLEPILGVALEGASFVTAANRDLARRQAKEIKPEAQQLDEQMARLVAVREGYDVVISGSLDRKGDGYALVARASESATGDPIGTFRESASGKDQLLVAVSRLAEPVRRALGDANAASGRMAAETFTAGSLQAAHLYAKAFEQQVAGNYDAALDIYRSVLEADPEFGRAYAGMAVIQRNLGRRAEAEQNFQKAIAKLDRMTERERLRTQGTYAVFQGNSDKAILVLGELVQKYPADTAGHVNLALVYSSIRDFPKAIAEARQAAGIYPKIPVYRNNLASLLLFAGQFEEARQEAEEALKINPNYVKAHLTRALALLLSGQADAAREGYERLRSAGKLGVSLAAMGFADLDLAQGRIKESLAALEAGSKVDLEGGLKAQVAAKQVLLAHGLLQTGQPARALAALDSAVAGATDENLFALAGGLYAEAGDAAKAEAMLKRLPERPDSLTQARAALLRGQLALARKQSDAALREMNASIGLVDTWPARVARGRAYAAAGDPTRAVNDFERAVARQGEGAWLVLDDLPTYSLVPPVLLALGQAQHQLKRPEAPATLARFLKLRTGAADPLAAAARQLQ